LAFCHDDGRPWTRTGKMMTKPTTAAMAPAVRRIKVPRPRAVTPGDLQGKLSSVSGWRSTVC
jgi:hypothetical protein